MPNGLQMQKKAGFCSQKTWQLPAVEHAFLLALFVTLQRMFVPFSPPESAPAAAHLPQTSSTGWCAPKKR